VLIAFYLNKNSAIEETEFYLLMSFVLIFLRGLAPLWQKIVNTSG